MEFDLDKIAPIVAGFKLMKFYPKDDDAGLTAAQQLASMAETLEQIEWTVSRAIAIFIEWPGMYEIRALFCSRWTPEDGITAYTDRFPKPQPKPYKMEIPAGATNEPFVLSAELARFQAKPLETTPRRSIKDLEADLGKDMEVERKRRKEAGL